MPEVIAGSERRAGGLVTALLTALLASGCSVGPGAVSSIPPVTTTTAPATTTIARVCTPNPRPPEQTIDGGDASAISITLSGLTFACADEAVITAATRQAVQAGAVLAAEDGIPLLVDGPEVAAELVRLGVTSVRWVGPAPAPRLGTVTSVVDPSAVPGRPPDPDAVGPTTWLFSGDDVTAAVVEAAAAFRRDGFTDVGGIEDLRNPGPEVLVALQSPEVVTVGLDTERIDQLTTVRTAAELPGGGFTFDGTRLVAFYGNPSTPFLGVLGEQGPAETLARLDRYVEEYSADGLRGIPTFEIIATVASARAGADGDYSDEAGADLLRPWIDFAAANGMYVVLDLQPGRTDFLTQARRYEEFLRLPHVGLALDPEWRLGPDQVHLRQIGTVDATEVNAVSRWLAGIVRDKGLPQKYFVVHQFRFSMITGRETIETPPELFTVIQMDGQGPLPTKYETFSAITAGQDDAPWAWGWKNFFDEDSPMAAPADVLELDPQVVFVSYQ